MAKKKQPQPKKADAKSKRKVAKKNGKRHPVKNYGGIDIPLGTSSPTTVSPLGEVALSGSLNFTPIAVKALVLRASETPVDPPPAAAVDCNFSGPNYSKDKVPRAHGALGTPDQNNVMVVWAQAPGGSWSHDTKVFAGQSSNNFVITVLAKNCIWFSWAPRSITGPDGESGDAYFPNGVAVPSDAQSVSLSASGLWRHDPANAEESDADGLSQVQDLQDNRYQSLTYNSLGINKLTANLNELVGIWEVADKPPTDIQPSSQIELGTSYNDSTWPNASRLFLACHDGYEWTDNAGSIDVTVEWRRDEKKPKPNKKKHQPKKAAKAKRKSRQVSASLHHPN